MQFKLNEVNGIKKIVAEICKRETISKTQYIAAFDYFDTNLLILQLASGGVSISSFATVLGASAEITSTNLGLMFSINYGIANKI